MSILHYLPPLPLISNHHHCNKSSKQITLVHVDLEVKVGFEFGSEKQRAKI
jgi:hypothetical protein